MIIKTNVHSGYYNDGNSEYKDRDTLLDLTTGIVTEQTTTTSHGQAGEYSEYHLDSHIARSLTIDQQKAIRDLLNPFIELRYKYPTCKQFRYFSTKQQYFMVGRYNKALKAAEGSDYVPCHLGLYDSFVLPHFGIVVTIYTGFQDRYSHFSVKITSTLDDSDLDYQNEQRAIQPDYRRDTCLC